MAAFERAPFRYDFYQAVRILESYFGTTLSEHRRKASSLSPVRFRPDNSMTFPSGDVKTAEVGEDVAHIVVTFMGLYGVSSPMPPTFVEETLTNGEALRDFLDIFNNRLCAFFFEAWERNRPELAEADHKKRMITLGGIDVASIGGLSPDEIFPFAGILGTSVRNPAGLETLVRDLTGIETRLEENVPRWVTITNPPGIGSDSGTAMMLGINSTIGRNMPDASGKFRLTMGPLDLAQYQDLLPGGSLADKVSAITDLYLQDDLAFDVRLVLQASEVKPVQLGNKGFSLGLNTWVGKPTTSVAERIVPYRN
jgi:type VI secretion system protein ImpH